MTEEEYDEAHSDGYRSGLDNGARKKELQLLPELERLRKENDGLRARKEMLEELISELSESAEYWSEYDVPIGIVDRIRAAVSNVKAQGMQQETNYEK